MSSQGCGGGVLDHNNGSMWAPGVSIVTTWEQTEEEEEQEGDDGESDPAGCNLLPVRSQPLATFGENIWVNGGVRTHHPPLGSAVFLLWLLVFRAVSGFFT